VLPSVAMDLLEIPPYDALIYPLLECLGAAASPLRIAQVIALLADRIDLPEALREQRFESGKLTFDNRVGWAQSRLRRSGLSQSPRHGYWEITPAGRALLVEYPSGLSSELVDELIPARSHDDDPRGAGGATGVARSVPPDATPRERFEHAIPDVAERRAALELFAYAIENAHDERPGGWELRVTAHDVALFAGRLVVCRVRPGRLWVSVMGPIAEELRTELGASEDRYEFKAVPGAIILALPIAKAEMALARLTDPIDRFVDEAMLRIRRHVTFEAHRADAVDYIEGVVGRDLPRPVPETVASDEDDEEPQGREPRVRGRAPIFSHGHFPLTAIIANIDQKTLALPDLQRPFVWEDSSVRDLLDSLFVGFPVGTLVFWQTSDGRDARAVGTPDALRASTLIIDGQQRLTSLYAVMRGAEVTEGDGSKRRIQIAFRPRDGRFEVADAAIHNDPEFVPNVTEIWNPARTLSSLRKELLQNLRNKGRPVDDAYEEAVEENLQRAQGIANYQFSVVTIQKSAQSAEANEEDVAEIFVRINNQGKRLGQADFVLTLLSVFHGDLRDRIENRAAVMSREGIIQVDTHQLLRATCAVGFGRARMSAIYKFLRGIDPVTGDASVDARTQRLDHLDTAADACLEELMWRDFALRVMHAGAVSETLVASRNAVINAYAFYVIGNRLGVPKPRLDEVASRWIFGTLLTARYSGSSETKFEEDLARVAHLKEGDGDAFIQALDAALAETINNDYWSHGVVGALNTQRARVSAALAFRSSQVILEAKALFSDQPLRNLLTAPGPASRSAREAHHLFPKAWLAKRGVRDRARINQVANLADVHWYENGDIGGSQGPAEYVPRVRASLRIEDDRWGRMCAEHALPPGWETMDYESFLFERRQRMAELTRVAYRQLGGEADAPLLAPPWFLPESETVWKGIAETERALRGVVREVYARRYGDGAASRIEGALGESERESLKRALRARPVGADPLSVVDYLYLGQLPPLLFQNEVWGDARARFGGAADAKQRLQQGIQQIAPVRNEIAHVREVATERLQRANLACGDILRMLRTG
jgi:hypothetical protein